MSNKVNTLGQTAVIVKKSSINATQFRVAPLFIKRALITCAALALIVTFAATSTVVLAADSFFVETRFSGPVYHSDSTEVYNRLQYDPNSGYFYFHGERGQEPRPMDCLGALPGLRSDELYFYSMNDEAGTLLLEHGPWRTLFVPSENRVVAANIGPMAGESTNSPKLGYFAPEGDEGRGLYVFTGETHIIDKNDGVVSPEISFLFLVKQDGSVSWLPFNDDISSGSLKISFDDPNTLSFSADIERTRQFLVNGSDMELPLRSTLRANLNLTSGDLRTMPGLRLLKAGETKIPTIVRDILKSYRTADGTLNPRFSFILPHMHSHDMMRTGLKIEGTPRLRAVTEANVRVVESRRLADAVRAAMAPVRGQQAAIEVLARIVSAMPSAEKFRVALLAGTTGVGKTWTAELLSKVIAPQSSKPLFKISFNEHRTAVFLNSLLFGSGPGYVGSDVVSALMSWLLNNPDSGVLLFDEIEKAEPEALRLLQTFLDKGDITIPPHLVSVLLKQYEKVDLDKWPRELREQTNSGRIANASIVLKLTNRHLVLMGTNAGAEMYNGAGQTGLQGRRLQGDQELRSANARFTERTVRQSLMARGYGEDLLARVQYIVPFHVVLGEDFAAIVNDRIAGAISNVEREFVIDLELDADSRRFLEEQNYEPLGGARAVNDNIESWLRSNIVEAVRVGSVQAGDRIRVSVQRGVNDTTPSYLRLHRNGEEAVAHQFVAGRPLPASPVELLERARTRLEAVLLRRIVGHREEIRQIVNAIIAQLQQSVDNPNRRGRPIVIYLDSTPGIGKTEIGKAVAEALFDDADGLTTVFMNQITTDQDFFKVFVEPMVRGVRSRPEAMVALIDELPRAGAGAYRTIVQNQFMSVIDEGRLPSLREGEEGVRLPPATIMIATGNLLESAFPGGEFMNNRQLQISYRGLIRHPERLRSIFEEAYHAALRSRLGDPILLSPLTDGQVATLRDRFFQEVHSLPRISQAATFMLAPSAIKFFEEEYVPIRGARWLRINIEKFIRDPLVAFASRQPELFVGAAVSVEFDHATREMRAVVTPALSNGPVAPHTEVLGVIPPSRSQRHPESIARDAYETSVHEIGHALIQRALFGENSVEEISTFGGAYGGGVTYMGTNYAGYTGYRSTIVGPLKLAVLLGGHVAEVLFVGSTSEGASNDFERTRKDAETMLLSGSTLNLAPFPMTTGPDGKPVLSERNRVRLEDQQSALLKYAGEIAKEVITTNRELFLEIAKALDESSDQTMGKAEFERLVAGRIKPLSPARLRELSRVDHFTKKVCNELLLPKQSLWERFVGWLKGLRG